jgi:hypothetical protein
LAFQENNSVKLSTAGNRPSPKTGGFRRGNG